MIINHNNRRIGSLGGLLMAVCFGVFLSGSSEVSADPVPRLSEKKFDEALVEMTGEYDRTVSQAQAARNPYVNKRLILSSLDPYVDPDDYGAVDAIQDKSGNYILQFATYSATRRAEHNLSKEGATEYVEPDYALFAAEEDLESDSSASDPGSLDAARISNSLDSAGVSNSFLTAGTSNSFTAASDSSDLWDVSMMGLDTYASKVQSDRSGASATVAVLDTGIAFGHPLLSGRIIEESAKSFVDGYPVNEDDSSSIITHGTHVAGIVVQCTQGVDVKLLPVRVLDQDGNGSISTVISGINYAVSKSVDVINMSIAGPMTKRSSALELAIADAVSQGVTVVVSSGNQTKEISSNYIAPAYISDCVVVGSVNSSMERASSSNYGDTVDVVAPGVDILSSIISTNGAYDYVCKSGTSMAAPHVSAEAALLSMMYSSYSAPQIERLIQQLAMDLGPSGKDVYYGYGLARLSYTVTFAPGEHGTFSEQTVSVVCGGATPSAPSVTCESGYSFAGWSPALSATVTEDVTYTATYTAAVTQEVTNTIQLINAIGTVSYTDSCKSKIDAARAAYAALDSDHQGLVTNYSTLTTAEANYVTLKAAAQEAAQKAAQEAAEKAAQEAAQKAEQEAAEKAAQEAAEKAAQEATEKAAQEATEKAAQEEAAQQAAQQSSSQSQSSSQTQSSAAQSTASQEPAITIAKNPSSVKVKVSGNKATVSWNKIKLTSKTKKVLSQIKSIQIQYSKDPSFTKNIVTKRVGKNKTKLTVKLWKKTTYYFRVRYVGNGGVSRWSSVKRIKTQ